jgi:hypothetical protein
VSVTLRSYQRRFAEYLESGGLRAVLVAHRRAGKDLTALREVYRLALQRVGVYWYMLPVATQVRKTVWHARLDGRRLLDVVFPHEAVSRVNESEMFIELKNGSLIQFCGSDSYDRLVGANPVGLVFSEYALAKPQSWEYLRPILRENGGWAAWISTPRGRNHLHKLYEVAKSEPEWFAELLTIHDTGALPASIIDEERRQGMPESLISSEYLCSFDAAQIGSVYGDLLEQLANRGGITTWETAAAEKVFTTWDLGMGDATAIFFWKVEGTRIDVIDYLEANGKPFSYYADMLEARGYKYEAHFLPHDSRARSWHTGVTAVELARERLGNAVHVVPLMPIDQGIMAARWLLQQDVRIHEKNCEAGLAALRAYSYAFDEDRRTFSNRPEHGWASHGSDAWRYLATIARPVLQHMKEPEPPKPTRLEYRAPTLDEMWDEYDREQAMNS